MQDANSRELKQKVEYAIRSIKRLNECLIAIEQTEQRFLRDPTHVQAEALKKIDAEILRQYKESIDGVTAVLNYDIGHQEVSTGAPASESDVKNMLRKFFLEEIKKQGAPIASSCGCWARKVTELRPGNFICVRHDGKFKLMVVKEWTPQGITAYDMSQVDSGPPVVEFKQEDCTLLPTMIPLKPLPRWEHAQQSTVLALPIERDGKTWPTIFEEAVVVSRPCDGNCDDGSGAREKRGYLLEFTDGVRRVVPEQFVAYYRENWQQK